MKINGRVVGAQDGGVTLNLPACYRSKATRGRLGCDEAVPDKDMLAKIDSSFAQRVVAALAARLSEADFGRVVGILKDADLITNSEEAGINESMSPRDDPEGAADSKMFPHYSRLKQGGISYSGSSLARVPYVPVAAADRAARDLMFPDYNRLK